MRDRVAQRTTNRPGHQSNAHMTMMRYLSAQARRHTAPGPGLKEMHAERAALAKHRTGRWAQTNPVHDLQRALDAVGLSGAAHPIRRLHHPGGEMMIPWGAPARDLLTMARVRASKIVDAADSREGRAAARAAKAEKRHQGPVRPDAPFERPAHWTDENFYLSKEKDKFWDYEPRAVARYMHPGDATVPANEWERAKWAQEDRELRSKKRKIIGGVVVVGSSAFGGGVGEQLYTRRQVANQKQADRHKLHSFLFELDATARSGQMPKAEAAQAHEWAVRQARMGYGWNPDLANARNYLHANYKPPRGGWEP